MSQGFIKLQRAAEELFESDLDAYLLLTQIAFRALRQKSKFNKHKLQPNQALVGDFETCHLTEKRYRTAKDRLENLYKIVAFKGTNKGTIATLLNTEIYDINSDAEGDQKGEPRADGGRTKGEPRATKEECKKGISEEGKEKKVYKEKILIREWVALSQEEIDKLFHLHGDPLANAMLDILDAYNTSREQKYKSDYGALKQGSWVHKEALIRQNPKDPFNTAPRKFAPSSDQARADQYTKEMFENAL